MSTIAVGIKSETPSALAVKRVGFEREMMNYLGNGDFELRIVQAIASASKSGDLDLLHVPERPRLDRNHASGFAAQSTTSSEELYLVGIGPHPLGPEVVMEHQYCHREGRHEVLVFDSGAARRLENVQGEALRAAFAKPFWFGPGVQPFLLVLFLRGTGGSEPPSGADSDRFLA